MKQTVVEWLEDKIQSDMTFMEILGLINQAKAMDEKNIKDSYSLGWQDGRYWPSKHCFESPTDYYDKTFKSE